MSNLSRRSFVQALAATGAAAPIAAACQTMDSAMPSGSFFASRKLPIGIQLYTLGDLMTKDMDGTLKQISQIGYKSVELAGYLGKTPKQLRASFDAVGLSCTSAHVGMAKGSATEPKLKTSAIFRIPHGAKSGTNRNARKTLRRTIKPTNGCTMPCSLTTRRLNARATKLPINTVQSTGDGTVVL